MSIPAYDWYMFGLGLAGFLGAVWFYRAGRKGQRVGIGFSRRYLSQFALFAGCVMALEGVLEFHGTVRWHVMALGLLVGAGCGLLAGRSWISRHPKGENRPQRAGVSRWFSSWQFVTLLLVVTLVLAMVPSFGPARAILSARTNLQAAGQEGLAGLFLVFGLLLRG